MFFIDIFNIYKKLYLFSFIHFKFNILYRLDEFNRFLYIYIIAFM
jgi:hypothetical protein